MLKITRNHHRYFYNCDCLVIGTGAGGAVTGKVLAESGLDVLFIDEGDFFDQKAIRDNPPSKLIPHLYRNNGAIPFIGSPIVGFAEARCVGGGTVINGGIFASISEKIREEWHKQGLQNFEEKVFHSAIREIEEEMQISIPTIGPGNLDSQKLVDIAKTCGLDFELSKRTMLNCKNTNQCPTGCPTGAKQSVDYNYLLKACENGAEILANLKCTKIIRENESAKYVIARSRTGERIKIRFKTLFLSAGAIQTPFLIRKSRLDSRAGKEISYHLPLKLVAQFDEELNALNGSSSKSVLIEKDFKMASSNLRPEYLALSMYPYGTNALNESLSKIHQTGIFMALLRAKSKGLMISTYFDQPIIINRYAKSDSELIVRSLERACELLFLGRARKIYLPLRQSKPIHSMEECRTELHKFRKKNLELLTVHAMSSCAMGSQPKTSVTNPKGALWNCSNIYITDASVLPSTTGCGPQATIMANALITAKRFVHEHS